MSTEVHKVTRETLRYLSDVWRLTDNPLDVSGVDIEGLEDGQYLVVWMMASVVRIEDAASAKYLKINYHAPMIYSVHSDLDCALVDRDFLEWTNGQVSHAAVSEIWQVVDEYCSIPDFIHNLPLNSVTVIDGNYCYVDEKTGKVYIIDALPYFKYSVIRALNSNYEYSYSVLVNNMTIADIDGIRHWLPLSQSERSAVLEMARRLNNRGDDDFPF